VGSGLVFSVTTPRRSPGVTSTSSSIAARSPAGCRAASAANAAPWEGLSTHFTTEFTAFALLLMRELPMRKVAALVGETDARLRRMLFCQVDAA